MKWNSLKLRFSSIRIATGAITTALVLSSLCVIGASRQSGPRVYEAFTQPKRIIKVAASESGRVAQVLTKRGDTVKQGDVLLVLDTQVLERSRDVAKARSENSAKLRSLQIDAKLKQDRQRKIQELYESGAGSVEENAKASADAEVAQLNVQAAIEEQNLNRLQLAEIEARIEQRRVRSPIDGIATEVLKEIGEFVALSEPQVFTVVQLNQLRATFFVHTDFATRLNVGQSLTLTLPTTRSETGRVLNAEVNAMVEHIGAVTQADSGRVRLDVLIDNRDSRYRSGVRCLLAN